MKTLNTYRKTAAALLFIAMLMPSISSCMKTEEEGGLCHDDRQVGFMASVGKVDNGTEGTKASLTSAWPATTIMLTSLDGSISVPVAVFETEGVESPETKGTFINDDNSINPLSEYLDEFSVSAYDMNTSTPVTVFDPELQTASWNGSDWSMADVYYWPQATTFDIYAYTNMPASEYAGIVIDEDARIQTLTYTVPRDTDDQTDILMAMYSGTGDNEGNAELLFYHALTSVQFSRASSMTEASGITEIIMAGVNYNGSVAQDINSPASFEWYVSNETTTVSQDNDGKPFELRRGIDGDPFLLIPQRVSGTRSVVLTVTLIFNGHEIPLNAIIDNAVWEAGKTYTYVIGYNGNLEVSLDLEEISDTQKGEAIIANTGTKKCYVRAIVDGFVIDKDQYIKRTYLGNQGGIEGVGAFSVTDGGTFGTTGDAKWNTNWVMGDDGFYYYTIPLEVDNAEHTNPASKTTPLFNSYVFNGLSAYEYYEMNISTQAIEWDEHQNYVRDNWGTAAAGLLQ